MNDTLRAGTAVAPQNANSIPLSEPSASANLLHVAYTPSTAECTPPASPQTTKANPTHRSFGSHRAKHPIQLQMDTTVTPAHDRPVYCLTPSGSPTLTPTALSSPKFLSRQRTASLLRHASRPSCHDEDVETMEQPMTSHFVAPPMTRQYSGPASLSLRTFFNPLSSNPVNSHGPAWNSSVEDVPPMFPTCRSRGMTATSQQSYQPPPALRSVTSIPDYSQHTDTERNKLSGTYKPNRGVPNWSHNDYYPHPPRPFRGEELRASFRSGATNTSSSFMEAGTERSSIATARSSIMSEPQISIYSRDQSRDRLRDRDDSPESQSQAFELAEDEEVDDELDAVGDVLDAYFYDEEDRECNPKRRRASSRHELTTLTGTASSEPPELSQTPSRDQDSLDSFQSTDSFKQWDAIQSHWKADMANSSVLIHGEVHGADVMERSDAKPGQVPLLQQLTPLSSATGHDGNPNTYDQVDRHDPVVWQRLSNSFIERDLIAAHSTPDLCTDAAYGSCTSDKQEASRGTDRDAMEYHNLTPELPQLVKEQSREKSPVAHLTTSHTKAHSKHMSIAEDLPSRCNVGGDAKQNDMPQRPTQLPDLDGNGAIPRRASTSVFDRRSRLFDLGMMAALSPATETSSKVREQVKLVSNQHRNVVVGNSRKPAPVVERDRYGFKKTSEKITVSQYNAWAIKYEDHITRRRNKWMTLMLRQGLPTKDPKRFPERCDKVKRYARKGYPPEWRGAMWWYYSGGQHMIQQKEMIGLYASLVKRLNRGELNKDDKDAIERDLDRTFPDNMHFRPDNMQSRPETSVDLSDGGIGHEPPMISDLREVLSCFALNNSHIGYCQSLNFIAGLLLLFLKRNKERVFILLTIITQNHLPGAHARSLANTEVNVLMMLIKDYLPKVWASINDTDLINSGAGSNAHPSSKFQRQPTVALSCTSWFMSIFVGVLPIETVLRVWDAFLYEGPRALYRYALGIFKLGEAEIKQYRPGDGELFMTVQNLPRTCLDPNMLHDLAFVKKGFGNLSQHVIDQKRLFWQEQNRLVHQTSVKVRSNVPRPSWKEEEEEAESRRPGLRRRASRRFRMMRG